MGYTKTAIVNIGWSGALRAFIRSLTFVKLAILARLLTPADFGLVGIASLVLAFLEIVTETGVNIFLIQEKGRLKTYLNTAFVVSILRGFLISLFVFIVAKPISQFFKSPDSLQLILLISTVPLIRGFINPSVVKFRKDLQFHKEFFLQSGIFLVDTAVAITISFITKNPSGLIIGMIAGATTEVLLTQLFITPKPKLKFNIGQLKKIINRGKWVTLAGFFNYLFENVDDMAVGRILSDTSLGIYQVAYKISSLPITEVTGVLNRVTLPLYVKINSDIRRLKRAYLKTLLLILVVVLPIGLSLFFFPNFVVTIILGDKWLEAVKLVQIMSFFGVISTIPQSTYPVFLSLKRQDIVTKITLVNILFLAIGLLFLIRPYGIIGAGISAIIGSLAGVPVSLYYLHKIFNSNKTILNKN